MTNSRFLSLNILNKFARSPHKVFFTPHECFSSDNVYEDKKDGKNVKKMLEEAATYEDEQPKDEGDVWSTSPYPKGASVRNQADHSFRPRINPSETSIILFPGQGTQYVGMNKDVIKFPPAKDLFDIASSILGYDLNKLCLQGPAEKLNRTEYAQPAILVCSLAALERLKEEKPQAIENCIATAGFSLGEISALVLAEVLSFEKAVKLVKIRAEAMELAAEMEKGAMLTVLYGPDSKLSEACIKAKEHAATSGVTKAYCGVSNYLFPHCKIVGGNEKAIQYLEENKSQFNLRKLKRLPVSGAFHTPLMIPASEVFYKAMKKANLSDPIIAVHSNIDGKHYENAEHIRRVLAKQIVAPVKWEQTLHILYERPKDMPFPKTYECGPGNSLSTILKMVNVKAWQECFNVKS
ncbi:unnamed protein product [Nezara viridula]|uniref:[acyl-carrier-protein] S-malonyltransferase n=1 Tax=Nezara viridula TaxID=85310 RepID=A0A9P0H230_NEZVI|nr:unnamed protein product [Nezara viridula]